MKKILFIAAAALLGLTACTEDYKDWTPQAEPTQPATVTFGNGSVTTVSTIDLNALAEDQTTVQVASIVPPSASAEGYAPSFTLNIGEQTYAIDADGHMSAAELQEIIASTYGRRPTARDITATISMWISNGSTTIKTATSDPFTIKAIPQAPVIEEAYYYVGAANGWSDSDQTYKLENGGGDVYDDPVFTVTIPAPKGEDGNRVDNWFKIAPASAYTRAEGFWGGDMIGAATNGQSDAEGRFVVGKNDEVAFAFCIGTPDDEALYYRIEFNMLDQTYKVTPVGFNEFIYEIGNESGWSEPHPLHGNGQGYYDAVIYLDGEFKFKPNKDNWNDDYEKASGDATSGTLKQDGGPNVDAVEPGFYFVQVDLKELTYKLTPVKAISIIGSVRGSWDTDVEMTYNENLKCWEARTNLNAGEFKFRANHDWAINWGGTESDLTQGGANLNLEAAGDYIIRLFLSDEAPAHCTVALDLGYPEFLYEIGNESGWSASHPLGGDGKGFYSGFYYLNGEFKFKPNADNWDNDYEKNSGDALSGTLKQDGGPNVDAAEPGVYRIDVDLAAMTYQLTPITAVSIIGSVRGNWDTDVDLAYNVDAGCWEVTAELGAGEWKFRANHDWAINWGGSESDLSQDGANLQLAEAGTYKVQLFLSYAGKHYCTVAKQ